MPVRVISGAAVLVLVALLVLSPPAMAGSEVAALQSALKSRALYAGVVDGIAGPLTQGAVVRFQRRQNIGVDGVAGPQTRAALGWQGRPGLGSRNMNAGDRGWDVAQLQFLLQQRGFPPAAGVDGVFGAHTASALANYQRAAGLAVDAIAGPTTLGALRGEQVSTTSGPVRFVRPVAAPIGDGFGAPRAGRRRHQGVDFTAGHGALVTAAGVGVTEFVGWNHGGYGNLVVIRHRLGYTTWYGHLSSITTWPGESVSGGTRIGYVGSTGYATGPHLHFEVRLFGNPLDPLPLMLTSARSSKAPPSRGKTGRERCRAGRSRGQRLATRPRRHPFRDAALPGCPAGRH